MTISNMARCHISGLFVSILFSVNIGLIFAVHLKVDPINFDGLDITTVEVLCEPDQQTEKHTQLIEIYRAGGKLVASVNRNQTYFSSETGAKYQVNGQIDDDQSRIFLKLVLLDPEEEDSGVYRCVLHHLDGATLNTDEASQNLTVMSLDMVLQQLEARVAGLKMFIEKKDAFIDNSISHMEDVLTKQDTTLNHLFDKGDFTSAFSASLSKPVTHAKGQPLVFDNVILQSDDYDATTGVYTASRDGLYYFYLTLGTTGAVAADGIYAYIKVNNKKVIAHLGTGSDKWRDENSVSTVVELKTDDTVQPVMANQGRGAHRDGQISLFGGYCIKNY